MGPPKYSPDPSIGSFAFPKVRHSFCMSKMAQHPQQVQQEDAQTPETLRKRSSGDPGQEYATATTSQDRRHSWEPPTLFRTLTQQQREDAHKKFANEQARPPRTIWHGLYQGYSRISTSKMLENKSSVARDHLGKILYAFVHLSQH